MAEHKGKGKVFALVAVAVVVFVSASAYGLHATSQVSFCTEVCHEMTPYSKELKFSSHAKDKDGKEITCAQCHLPAGIGPKYLSMKIYLGTKDLAVHFWNGDEPLDRVALQPTARRFIDDASCLACHEDLYKDAKGEKPISDIGRLTHDAYLNKNGNTKSNCAGCHVNMAHLPKFDRRLDVNKKFAANFPLQEEQK